MTVEAPISPADADAYRAHRQAAAERSREKASAGQDIGELPPVGNPKRRARAMKSFRVFCETYFADTFALKWSDDHLKVIGKIEDAVLRGGQQAIAMPRGSGKTSLCERACMWAVLRGSSRYVVLIGADATAAAGNLETILTELESNDLLLEDFPEVCYPIAKLEGVQQRKLRYKGERIYYEFTADRIILPTIPESIAADSVIDVAGITARLRGRKYLRHDGKTARPDLVLIDDPQTDETAKSLTQVAERERIVSGAVLGMAGPSKNISALMTVTVIQSDDFADRSLNRKLHPEWHGEKTKMLYALPTDMKLWEEYWKIRSEEMQADGDGKKATAFYRKNRKAMDEGAVVAWKQRFRPGEISAVQHAMNLRFADPDAFAAECQNEPNSTKLVQNKLTPEQVRARVTGLAVAHIPPEATILTAGVDVHDEILYWVLCAWEEDFTGQVVQYGTFPEQSLRWFQQARPPRPLSGMFPGMDKDGVIQAGLEKLCRVMLDMQFEKTTNETRSLMQIEQLLVDRGYKPRLVENVRRRLATPIMQASLGRAISAKGKPLEAYERRRGWKFGDNWHVPSVVRTTDYPHLVINTNHWKTYVHRALSISPGSRGALTLFGSPTSTMEHELFSEHVAASEHFDEVEANGRRVCEWKVKPGRPDNHWLDCLVMATVGASMRGCKPPAETAGAKVVSGGGKRRVMSLAEMANK